MDGTRALLFGIALICYSGLLVVGRGVGNFDDTVYWGMHLGLAVATAGFLFGDFDGEST